MPPRKTATGVGTWPSVAAVIGAASGIGQAIAIALAEADAVVECGDIDSAGLEETVAAIVSAGGTAKAATVDVRVSADVDGMLTRVRDERGQLGIAVGTPGINVRKPLVDYTDEEYTAVTDVNLRGSFHVYVNGEVMYVDGGWVDLDPPFADEAAITAR